MTRNLKSALFSALLVWAVAYPVLGLKLTIVGINIEVHNTSTFTLSVIAICSLLMFVRVLFNQQLTTAWRNSPSLPKVPTKATNFLTLPSTQRWIILGLVVVALIWPFYGSRGAVDIATLILIYVMLGLGLNIVVGLAGLLDLGYVGFYAVGAYTYALLAHYFGLSFWICLPLAGLMAATFGFLLGFPVLRLRGDYLAIVTLGFGEIIRIFLNNLDHPVNLTNGPKGLGQIDSVKIFGLDLAKRQELFGFDINSVTMYYYLFLALVLITIVICYRLQDSRIGRAWMAIREDEIAAKAMGINTRNMKLLAFGMGASFGGVSGAMFGAFQGFVSPESFSLMESVMIVAMVVLGGIGHIPGVILGAVLLSALPEVLRYVAGPLQAMTDGRIDSAILRQLLIALAMIVIMLLRPRGLWPAPERGKSLTQKT